MQWLSDGFSFKREDRNEKDIWIYLIDYSKENNNSYNGPMAIKLIQKMNAMITLS